MYISCHGLVGICMTVVHFILIFIAYLPVSNALTGEQNTGMTCSLFLHINSICFREKIPPKKSLLGQNFFYHRH